MSKPLVIELFCGMFGWSAGWLALGGEAVGFDIEHQPYHGPVPKGASLVLQDVLTLHGSQFKDAALILASSPCQAYSYMAMPWTRAKQIARALRGTDEFPAGYVGYRTIAELNALFEAPKRIQREASEAAGRYIPMIQENVRGAIPWVGRSAYHFGSFYLWGDVPAVMPMPEKARKVSGFRFDGSGRSFQTASVEGTKVSGMNWSNFGKPDYKAVALNDPRHGSKNGGDWFGSGADCSAQRRASSKSSARKMAAARIAKIPAALSRHIAQVYYPQESHV